MKNINVLTICLSIVLAATLIAYSVINSARMISSAIDSKEIGISEVALTKILKETRIAAAQSPQRPQIERPAPGSKKVEGVTPAGNAIKGNPNAKVLMVEFSDFQCPFSKRFYQGAFPKIDAEYISTGKVKFVYRDFPLSFHKQAKISAIAGECAGEQGKYWQMFDKLINSSSFDVESLKKYAEEIGVDSQTFDQCLDNQETKEEVENDFREAQKFGVKGTPAFFINGRFVNGALPFEVFKKIIDEELSK